ncbi:MAG: hypothetical protein JWQ87_5442 [Candidatus Sulfotelmatobacter sp.]|nr:hypothetical protein [Candidatus Sulfotelmatobacter sp.]
MKRFLILALLCLPASAQIYVNLDDTLTQAGGWQFCNLCAGGTGTSSGVTQTINNTSPVLDDGKAMLVSMTGPTLSAGQTTNELWYWKAGASGSVNTFSATWDVNIPSVSNVTALEYDLFHFTNGTRFMIGSQCITGGVWQIWNSCGGSWLNTSPSVSCNLTANTKHTIVWNAHHDPITSVACAGKACEYYDSLIVDGVKYGPFAAQPACASGDADNVGTQFQIDVNSSGGTATEYLDNVSLTASVAGFPGGQGLIPVVFPPESGTANAHFKQYVMPQPAIWGVTDQFLWKLQETTTTSSLSTDCTANPPDQCQQDSVGLFHTYNFANADGILAQWFDPNAGWGQKKVNVFATEQTNGPNSATPYYMTQSAWTSVAGTQHYINAAKDACSQDVGATITTLTRTSPSFNATATINNTYHAGDIVWIYGASDSSFNIVTEAGTPILTASATQFTYATSANTTVTPTGAKAETQVQSWFVPTDPSYTVAAKAYIAAVIYHFNNSANLANIGYSRIGPTVRGAEIVMLCPDQMVSNGYPGYASQAQAKTTWLAWYTDMVNYVASQNPLFQVMDPINPGWTGSAPDFTYDAPMAAAAIAVSNANGLRNGFGSQGLQQTDITNYHIPSPPYCAADWCNQVNNYSLQGFLNPGTQPNEGQQIDCSDPTATWTNGSWVSGLQGVSCFQLGSGGTSKSKTGDLRVLLPFDKAKHITILELYNIDALLAFDPTYCANPSGSACGSGSVPAAVFGMRCVGPTTFLDATCPNGVGGDGTYAQAFNTFAGFGYQVGCTDIPANCATGLFTIGKAQVGGPPNYPLTSVSTATLGTLVPPWSPSTLFNSTFYSPLNPTSDCYTRLTDQNVTGPGGLTATTLGQAAFSGSGGGNDIDVSLNSTYFGATHNSAHLAIFHLDTSGPCARNITNGGENPVFELPAPFAFSRVSDPVFYYLTNSHILNQATITSDSTYTITSNANFPFDFDNCPGPVGTGSASSASILNVAFSDSVFSTDISWTGGQGTARNIVAYKPGSGCSTLDVGTGNWYHYCSVNCSSMAPSGTETACLSTGWSTGSGVHGTQMTTDGLVAVASGGCFTLGANNLAYWQIDSGNVLGMQDTSTTWDGSLGTGGHDTVGATHFWNTHAPTPKIRVTSPLTTANLTAYTTLQTFSNVTALGDAFHGGEPHPTGDDSYPWILETGSTASNYLTPLAYQNEIFAIPPTANAPIPRFGSTYNSGTLNQGTHFGCGAAIPIVSQDGNWAFILSDGDLLLGNGTDGVPLCSIIAVHLQ